MTHDMKLWSHGYNFRPKAETRQGEPHAQRDGGKVQEYTYFCYMYTFHGSIHALCCVHAESESMLR